MNPVARAAADIVDAFDAEVQEIESIFATCRGGRTVLGFTVPYTPTEDGCLVSLWDAWNRFLRSLALNAAAGPHLALSGKIYTPASPRTELQCMAHLAASRGGKAYRLVEGEPKWFDVRQLDDVMTTLGLDQRNSQTVVSAIGASTIALGPITISNPLEEVRSCRNFVAHKASKTLAGARRYGRGAFVSLSDHMRHPQVGVETFSVWCEALSTLAAAAAQ